MTIEKSLSRLHYRLMRFTRLEEHIFFQFHAYLLDDKGKWHASFRTHWHDYFRWTFTFATPHIGTELLITDDEDYVISRFKTQATGPQITYEMHYDVVALLRARRSKAFLINGITYPLDYTCKRVISFRSENDDS